MISTHDTAQQAEFISSMIYLMWHGKNQEISLVEPTFKHFCYQILIATQLKETAIYIALRYISILLNCNPTIEGAKGSEYRLFVVSLMLANKFLDDNTFTNKTWSDISGMDLNDINRMESEFLEALDYNLFVKQDDYSHWKLSLDEFYNYYNYYHYYYTYYKNLQIENSKKRYQQFFLNSNSYTIYNTY